MPHLISADASVPGCELDLLRALDAPLLTNARIDGWWNERFNITTPISASLRISVTLPTLSYAPPRQRWWELPNKKKVRASTKEIRRSKHAET
jgi:hypothetical protein